MGRRIYMTDAARRRLAMRDELPEGDDPRADFAEMQQRVEIIEQALKVLIMRQADGPAGTTCTNECQVDNPDEDEPRNVEVLKAQHVPGSMGDVFDELPSIADINRKNGEFWKTAAATPTASATGNPQADPAPGNANTGKGANYMPNAAGTISAARKLSTTARSLDMGKTGSWSTDRRVYTQIIKPSRATADAARASIRTREAAAAHSSATLAGMNKKARSVWGG